jgi:hypothetical protein
MRATAVIVLSLSFAAFSSPIAVSASPREGAPAGDDHPGAKEFKACKKLPAGKRVLKLNLKPDSEVKDLVGWMSTISCAPFVFAATDLQGKKVTVLSPQLLTPEEAYQLFIGALASVDLTIEPMSSAGREGGVLRVVRKPSR